MFWIFSLSLSFLPFAFGLGNFEVGIITLNPYVAGMCLLVLIAAARWLFGAQPEFIGLQDIFIILLALTYLVSTLLADDIVDAGFLAFHALFVPVISYFAVRVALQSNQQYALALKMYIVSVFLFSLYFFSTFITSETRGLILGVPPIGIATLTTSALVMAFNMKDSRMIRWVGLIIIFSLLLTFSRAYILTLLFTPLLWRWVRKGYAGIIVTVFLFSTLFLTVIVSYEPEIFMPTHYDKSIEFSVDRLTNIDFLLGSIYGRAIAFRGGIDSFLESPIFGHGLFSGEYMVTQHNFHVEWLQYGGMFGYLLYASVLIVHSFRTRRYAINDHWVAANLVTMIIILVNSVTNGLMHGVMPYMVFLLMGFNEARILINKRAKKGTDSEDLVEDIVETDILSTRILQYSRKSMSQHGKKNER